MDDNAIRLGMFGEEYSENFENAYGKIAPDQTWDFSTINLRNLGLYGGPSSSTAATRAAYTGSVDATPATEPIIKETKTEGIDISNYGDYYAVEQGTLDWLNRELPEGTSNVSKGNPFVLGTPTNDFAIIPIYQGHAGMCWDLHLVDKTTNKDYTIWSKSDGIRHELDYSKSIAASALTNGEEYFYSMKMKSEGGNAGYWGDGNGNSGVERIYFNNAFNGVGSRNTSGGDYVQVWFQLPAGATITGYFEKEDGNEKWGYKGGEYTTFGNAGSTSEQWVCYDLVSEEATWNSGDFAQLTWHNQGTVNCKFSEWEDNRVRIYTRYNYQTTKKLDDPKDVTNLTGNTVNRTGVGAKPILINHEKINGDFFLYLNITQQDPDTPGYAAADACQRSDEGMMVALPLERPTNITNGYEYMIIGCEDSNTEISDWDVNDICFLIVGQGTLPKVKETIAKRYMIEDLGSTYDFDFNDIVVDVTQTTQKNYDGTEYSKVQTAEIKTLGGTLPFKVKVGDTEFDEVNPNSYHSGTVPQRGFHPSAYNWAKKDITGWDPSTNNIKITVGSEAKENATELETARTINFPEEGKIPYIIAVDQTVDWSDEEVKVPSSWFKTWPANYDNWPNHSQDTPGDDQGSKTQIWSGSAALNGYDNDATKLQIEYSLNKGDKIEIEYTYSGSGSGVIQVFERAGTDWTWGEQKDKDGITSDGSMTCIMNSENEIHGIAIQGENVTITKVSKVN